MMKTRHFDNGALSKIDDVLAEDGGLLHVLHCAPQILRTSRVDHSGPFLLSELFCGTPLSCFDDVLAEDGGLLHVLPLAVHLIRVDHSGPFLFSELFCGTPPSCLKVMGG